MSAPRDPAELARRLCGKDAALWTADPVVQGTIRNRLGWLDLPERMRAEVATIRAFADEVRRESFRQALVLGMGGSSLCVELLAASGTAGEGPCAVRILDSTVPAAVTAAATWASQAKTLVVVSSKSGTTIETAAFARFFRARLPDPRRFVAITDPGSALDSLARAEGFRAVFAHPADVGGRFAVLSPVGLVPAALLGLEPAALLDGARRELKSVADPAVARGAAAIALGLELARRAGSGDHTLGLSGSGPQALALAAWIEQLVAESTGKGGLGLVPVPPDAAGGTWSGNGAPIPVWGGERPPAAAEDLGAALVRWELATAVAGVHLGVNSFDEPDVRSAKERTQGVLAAAARDGRLVEPPALAADGSLAVWGDPKASTGRGADAGRLVAAHLGQVRAGDYTALLAFLSATPTMAAELDAVRRAIAKRGRSAVTCGLGPRYLHSTGQLHKGGPNTGVFLMLTAGDAADVPIPGEPHTFGRLCRAQALGDFQALVDRGRRVMRVHLAGDPVDGLRRLRGIVAG